MSEPMRERKISITEDDLAERAQRLGLSPARNEAKEQQKADAERSTTRFDVERTLALIRVTDNSDDLNRIGRAAADRLRRLGATHRRKERGFTDRALLRLYLEVTPLLLSLFIVAPLLVWGGLALVRSAEFAQLVGRTLASQLAKACPPTCTWYNLALWAVLGGASFLTAFLVSYSLRKRLLRAAG